MRLGALFSGVVGLILATTLSPEALDSIGWRIAFVIGPEWLSGGMLMLERVFFYAV